MIAREVSFEGRVQGVGFRYSVKELAKGFDVTGWVENRPDGRVFSLIQGDKSEVDAFVGSILESHLRAHIGRHIVREQPISPGLRGFEIR
jgi:acylphosphatase